MQKMKMIVLLFMLGLIVGCGDNIFPELINVVGSTGNVGYLDHVQTTAVADIKGWTNTEVYFRYATSADKVKSPDAIELRPICSGAAPQINCSIIFPDAWTKGEIVFDVGTTVYYQWFLDYSLPNSENDVATIESSLRSFMIVEPQSCISGSTEPTESCLAGQVCVRDPLRANQTGDTLAPTVCRIPEPN